MSMVWVISSGKLHPVERLGEQTSHSNPFSPAVEDFATTSHGREMGFPPLAKAKLLRNAGSLTCRLRAST